MSNTPTVEAVMAPVSEQAMGGGIEGASRNTRELMQWTPPVISPDQQINPIKDLADARGVDRMQNDGYVTGAIHIHRDSIVGATYRLNAQPEYRVLGIYAWTRYANTIDDGIRLMHNSVQAGDTANYTIDTSVVDVRFDNNSATPLMITGGYIRRSDGTTVIGEGSIQLDPGRAYVAAGATAITVPTGERVVTLAASGGYLARS